MTDYHKPRQNQSEPVDLTCPTPVDTLAKLMASSSRRRPKMFPADNREAAIFWINHQEPKDDYTEAATKEGNSWKTPYHDRLARTLRIFLAMNDLHQTFVIQYTKTIPWRGEDHDYYHLVVKENQRMQGDPHSNSEKARKAMKNFKCGKVPDMPTTNAAEADEQARKEL